MVAMGTSTNMAVYYVLSLCIYCLPFAMAAENSSTGTTESPGTTIPPFTLELFQQSSDTNLMVMTWKTPAYYNPVNFTINSRKLGSTAITLSGAINANERSYTIEDLATEAKYKVCIKGFYEDENLNTEVCDAFKTIPMIRWDSVLVLILVLLTILGLVLLGILFWYCHKKRLEKDDDEEKKSLTSDSENDTGTQNLTVKPPTEAPLVSIEDEDIPYITPPIHQLSPAEREEARLAAMKQQQNQA